MIRLTRLTDYGIMLLTHFARDRKQAQKCSRDLAAEAHLPLPTVSKLLKLLARHGLLEAHRGAKGGFLLARPPEAITMAERLLNEGLYTSVIFFPTVAQGAAGLRMCPTATHGIDELDRLADAVSRLQPTQPSTGWSDLRRA